MSLENKTKELYNIFKGLPSGNPIVRENTEIEWNQTHCCRMLVYDGLLDAPNEGAFATQTLSL